MYVKTSHEGCFCCCSENLCMCFEVQQKVIYNIKGLNRLVKGLPDVEKNYIWKELSYVVVI